MLGSVTVALGTPAPLGSVMAPVTSPDVMDWALPFVTNSTLTNARAENSINCLALVVPFNSTELAVSSSEVPENSSSHLQLAKLIANSPDLTLSQLHYKGLERLTFPSKESATAYRRKATGFARVSERTKPEEFRG
jgi:hypothetical protein